MSKDEYKGKITPTKVLFGVQRFNPYGPQYYSISILTTDKYFSTYGPISVDVLCENMSQFPMKVRSAIKMLAPFQIKNHTFNSYVKDRYYHLSFAKESSVSKETIIENLQQIIDAGDPVIMLDIFKEDMDICLIPTKASLLLRSFNTQDKGLEEIQESNNKQPAKKQTNKESHNKEQSKEKSVKKQTKQESNEQQSILYKGQLPVYKKKSNTYYQFRWLLVPLLFVLGCWLRLLNPELVQQNFKEVFFDQKWLTTKSVKKLLPIMPKNLLEAYQMGEYVKGYFMAEQAQNHEQMSLHSDLLKNLTGREEVSPLEMQGIKEEIEAFVNYNSITQRVYGMLSFVNIIWFFALIGMTITIGPFLYAIFGHWLAKLIKQLCKVIVKIVEYVLENIIIPVVSRLHEWGIIEIAGYLTAYQLILEASFMKHQESVGIMVALTGMVINGFLFWYSTFLHARKIRAKSDERALINLFLTIQMLSDIPLAIILQSTLLGYKFFASFYHTIGFQMLFFGLGIGMGWNSIDALKRNLIVSSLIVASMIGLRLHGINNEYLVPFNSSTYILGANMHYLAILIFSSKYSYRYEKQSLSYVQRNLISLLSLCAGIAIGKVFVLEGLANTAIVFLVLWLIEKYHELFFYYTNNIAVFVFTVSTATYYGALWINTHPEYVMKMFQFEF